MNILVTGAAGFIGSHLSERLIDLGHTVPQEGLKKEIKWYKQSILGKIEQGATP